MQTFVEFVKKLIAFLTSNWDTVMPPLEVSPVTPEAPKPAPTPRTILLGEYASSLLGKHLSLDESIPWGVGCAEAISKVLKDFGVQGIPDRGFPGTVGIGAFLRQSNEFRTNRIMHPGVVILEETGTGNGLIRGHVGIVLDKEIIASNNSETGKFSNHWTIQRWDDYYRKYGGIPTQLFECIYPDPGKV